MPVNLSGSSLAICVVTYLNHCPCFSKYTHALNI